MSDIEELASDAEQLGKPDESLNNDDKRKTYCRFIQR